MSTKAGTLLWNRIHVTFPPDTNSVTIDTGIRQVNKSFPAMSPGEPSLADPTRIQVIPLAPTAEWSGMGMSEPVVNPATGTIEITFGGGLIPEPPFQRGPLNVLVWDPHSIVGPGDADIYNDD
jgi:hypothetical protein